MGRGPGSLSGVALPVAKEIALETLAGLTLIADRALTKTDDIADGLILGVRNVDIGELPGAEEAGKVTSVTAVGLDAIGGALRDEGRGNDFADEAFGAKVSDQSKTGGAGFVDEAEFTIGRGLQLGDESIDVGEFGADGTVIADFTVGTGDGDLIGKGVDIEGDVFDDGFHG